MEKLSLLEKLELYKKITIEIDNVIELNYEKIEEKLNKRQDIIDSIKPLEMQQANYIYRQLGLDTIDEDVKSKIIINMKEVKEEIKEYRKNKAVNFMYSRNSKEKMNIFSKKV